MARAGRPTQAAVLTLAAWTLACGGGDADVTTNPAVQVNQNPTERKVLQLGLHRSEEAKPAILAGTDSSLPPPPPGLTFQQCKDLTEGGEVKGPDCITDTIKCGDTIIGHTIGGTRRWGTRWYEKNFCTPAFRNFDGGDERVYRLDMPEGPWRAYVTLDSPCADLHLAGFPMAMRSDTRPGPNSDVTRCEMYPDNHTPTRERIELVSDKPMTWLLAVEGTDDDEGAFSLTVQCRPGLQ